MEKLLNNDILVQALELYEEQRLGKFDTLEGFEPSEKFKKRMNKLIKSQTNVYHRATYTRSRRVLATAAAVLILLASLMSVGAVREAVLGFFVSHSGQTDYLEPDTEGSTYPTKIESPFKLSYIPEGYKPETELEDEKSVLRVYEHGDEYISIEQFTKDSYTSAADNDFPKISTRTVGGTDYVFRRLDDDSCMIVWDDGSYVFELVGFLPEEEMFRVAQSVTTE